MSNQRDIELMAHLMRRAAFGASRTEIEALLEQGYENTVEELLNPEEQPDIAIFPLQKRQLKLTKVNSPGCTEL